MTKLQLRSKHKDISPQLWADIEATIETEAKKSEKAAYKITKTNAYSLLELLSQEGHISEMDVDFDKIVYKFMEGK